MKRKKKKVITKLDLGFHNQQATHLIDKVLERVRIKMRQEKLKIEHLPYLLNIPRLRVLAIFSKNPAIPLKDLFRLCEVFDIELKIEILDKK